MQFKLLLSFLFLTLLSLSSSYGSGIVFSDSSNNSDSRIDSLTGDSGFEEESNLLTRVDPLDPMEAEESAKLEEEEMEQEIGQAETEIVELAKAEQDLEVSQNDPEVKAAIVKAKAVHNLMQIFGLSESLMKDKSLLGSSPAPEFMIELYNTITDSSGVTRAKNPYNAHVVRSFIERDSSLNDFFYFNISSFSLEATESILEAELHLHRMPTPHSQLHPSLYLTPFYIISLYQVKDPNSLNIPDLHKLLGVRYVNAVGSGWEVFNVKKSVMEWLDGNTENHGFLVAATSLGGDRVPLRFARRGETVHSKQPILVLFNHDSHMANMNQQQMNNEVKKIRKKKIQMGGVPDNEYSYETTTPLSSLENPQFHHSLLFQDSIRHPNSVSRFRSRRSRTNETTDEFLNHLTRNGNETIQHHRQNLTECGLNDLFVSFEAIGWSSWIISPKGYNAHYCDGPCVFPLGKNVSPTNHATVQSIINELNLNPGLSRPCCVPTTLLPISLLYYDDQDNVVLKQYVDMVAENCGCH